MYREGTRNNNFKQMFNCGLQEFIAVTVKFEVSDSLALTRMPDEIEHFIEGASSINTSGQSGTSEGPDFRLEVVSKQTQSWMPKVPSGEDWKIVCNNFDSLILLRDKMFYQMGLNDPKIGKTRKCRDYSKEIEGFRTVLRQRKYILEPESPRGVTSLSGRTLDSELVSIF